MEKIVKKELDNINEDDRCLWYKPTNEHKKFRPKYENFIKEMIKKSQDNILYDIKFLPELIKILIVPSGSSYGILRHISTITGLIIGESLLKV